MRNWIRGAALLAALTASVPALAQGAATGTASSPPPKTALQLMLQKGVITQAEYDAAIAAPAATEVIKEVRETVVVQESPKLNPPPVTSKWNATMYGFIEADFIYDSTQSFADLAGNGVIAANGYAAKNHRLQFSVRNTRLGFRFAAPEWGSVKSTAVLEMDFFGNQPSNPPPAAGSLVSEGRLLQQPGHAHPPRLHEAGVADRGLPLRPDLGALRLAVYFHPNTVDLQGVPARSTRAPSRPACRRPSERPGQRGDRHRRFASPAA